MADFYTDIHSIQHAVHQSRSKDEAKDKFYNMHGISLTRDQAELAYKDAMKKRFPKKQETQATFRKQVESKYIVVVGIETFKDIYNTDIEIWRENDKVLSENFDLTHIFPTKYLDKISMDSEKPTTLELEVIYNITPGYKGDFENAPEGPDVEITGVTAYLDNKTKFNFDKVLDLKKGRYTMRELWMDAL